MTASARPSPRADNLRLRIVSSAVLIAVSVAVVEAGVAPTAALGAGLGLAMAAEWLGVTRGHGAFLRALGLLYVGGAFAALAVLRSAPLGPDRILWLFALTWSGDVAAYAFGRAFARHMLPAAISDHKSWEGLCAGCLAATLAGFLASGPLGWSEAERWAASGALAVTGQLGDLLQSAVKRRLGVKDMGSVIPGHGGVADRLDSLLLVLWLAGGALLVAAWGVRS